MNLQPHDRSARAEGRDLKTFTLRIPVSMHEQLETAARINDQSLNQFITEAAQDSARRVLGEGQLARASLAVLIDLDAFSSKPPLNVEALEQLAMSLGRPTIKCSFSSSGASSLDQSRQALLARHYRHEELPSREALRLRIASEAVQLLSSSSVRDFMVVSADEQFGFVASILARQGATVTGIGVHSLSTTSPEFIRAFESYRAYDQIAQPPASDELRRLRDRYAESLLQIALKLENRGAKPVGAAVIPILKDRHPELSLELLGLRSWRDLAEIAQELGFATAVEPSGADFVVQLSEKGRTKASEMLAASDKKSAQVDEVESFRQAIAQIVGAELPDTSTRFLIFNAAEWVLNDEVVPQGMSLVDLSYRVTSRLQQSGVEQNTVYRLVNGLYRCGAFEFRSNSTNDYDPYLLRSRIPVSSFDDAFVLNLMRSRRRFPVHASPEVISWAIYGIAEHASKIEKMLKLAGDTSYGRGDLAIILSQLRGKEHGARPDFNLAE